MNRWSRLLFMIMSFANAGEIPILTCGPIRSDWALVFWDTL